MSMKLEVKRGSGWRHLTVALLLAACGGMLGKPTVGGESHFLRFCGDGCGAGLECVTGICTRGCLVGEAKCGDLATGAICTDASIEPGALAVCDVSCERDRDCATLGTDFTCDGGFCRGPALPVPGGHGGSSASGGSGGNGSEVLLNCGTWVRCADSSACAPGESCIALPGCGQGICGCPEGICQQNCDSECTFSGTSQDKVAIACPSTRIDGFESSAGSGGYPPGYNGASCGQGGTFSSAGTSAGGGGAGGMPGFEPPLLCSLPFDSGPCDAAIPRYAAVDGQCVLVSYGGCEGNENNFTSLEECLKVCEGRPGALPCPAGRVVKEICVECGLVGGCPAYGEFCTQPCADTPECESPWLMCFEGTCQQYGCE